MIDLDKSETIVTVYLKRRADNRRSYNRGSEQVEEIVTGEHRVFGPVVSVHFGEAGGREIIETIPISAIAGVRVVREITDG